eukprot:CAMPEP_0197013244 /NCGR_PEP_ID=MMETSP1380-20130617/65685_1 /TAXON_ID=5936 /ORGANISM="Euplotes crassus, Strain CT5" /LENGTH=193 /DNA_ID=CAMNT_0042437361 /DNA_START=147 /DNA_END=725 /DNA_ORIENTATION=-
MRDYHANPITFNWICTGGNATTLADLEASHSLEPVLSKLYGLQNQLINILHNHYTIRNSLDTHFVVTKLDEIEEILIEARLQISRKSSTSSDSQLDESGTSSFNPFIEIGEDLKEEKFVHSSTDQEIKTQVLTEVRSKLETNYEYLSQELDEWLTSMPEAEAQDIAKKHLNLQNKLRWEKIMSSGDKLKNLQS